MAWVSGVLVLGLLPGLLLLLSLRHQPQAVLDKAAGGVSEAAASRLVTKAAAVYEGLSREGPWETVIGDHEINSWLALDLPRNHAGLLPAWVQSPSVRILPKRIAVGAWLGYGLGAAYGWVDLQVELHGVNQIWIRPLDARLGLVPVPKAAVLRRLAGGIEALGLITSLRRLDDSMLLVVSIPSSGQSGGAEPLLESLRLDDGEMFAAGTTRRRDDGTPTLSGSRRDGVGITTPD